MNAIVATAIILRAMLHEDHVYCMLVTAAAIVITASVNAYLNRLLSSV